MESNTTIINGEARLQGNLGLLPLVFIGIAYMNPLVIYGYYGIISPMTGGMYALTILCSCEIKK